MPITAVLIGTHPVQLVLMTGEKRCGEYQRETMLCVRNIGDHAINHRIRRRDKRLLVEPDARIVEDPHAMMFVRRS